jgi:hypothetical protein
MPTYLDFDSTRQFRDFIIGKTLNVENGPQTFTSANYIEHSLNDFPDIDPGDVTTNLSSELLQTQNSNIFKPIEYMVKDTLEVLPRRANLHLYPYFQTGQYHNLIGILINDNYDTESELFKFAAQNIKENPEGPVQARIRQNLYTATVGRLNILDALQGNTATAVNLLTGKQPLIEYNNKITVAKTLPGKVIDFAQTIAGVEFPWAEIPGDYLSNPRSPDAPMSAISFLGAFFGINKRSKSDIKPSDLFIQYMGSGQKQVLFDNLSFSKYAPNYTTTARNQNTSKVFNFVNNVAQGVRNALGIEAPAGVSYIGDDRSNDVKSAMNDLTDMPLRSSYYLGLMFDDVQTNLLHKDKNIGEGGGYGGKLTWISSKSRNKLGANNAEYGSESSQYEETLSTKFTFREDSLLGYTQNILEMLPTDGGASRSHVANAIDQTSRVFRDGDLVMSRGSAVKYVDKFTGEESGVEYCRVWTKDRSYSNNSDLMKKTGLIRKSEASVLSTPYNLNIYPNSNGNGDFDSSSTNIVPEKDGFYAKKYMFSLENLAWRSSNTPGFTYNDLPYCERGNNGGRVMWFPPYDLKISEQNSARWYENEFLGRPEPIYTYQNTTRAGTVSFKVIVDHPSILNLLVREKFKGMSDEESDNYINAFFSGCENIDFYGLIRKYVTLSQDDIQRIIDYLNASNSAQTITKYKSVLEPVKDSNAPEAVKNTGGDVTTVQNNTTTIKEILYFNNDIPKPSGGELYGEDYETTYQQYLNSEYDYVAQLKQGLNEWYNKTTIWSLEQQNDQLNLYGTSSNYRPASSVTGKTVDEIQINAFAEMKDHHDRYSTQMALLKNELDNKTVQKISINIESATSAVADDKYNHKLSYRRSDSIIKDIINRIKATGAASPTIKWPETSVKETNSSTIDKLPEISFKDLGYSFDGTVSFGPISNLGEQSKNGQVNYKKNIDCHERVFKTSTLLKKTSPLAFYCRESTVTVVYESKPIQPGTASIPPGQDTPELRKVTLIQEQVPKANKKPPLDELKRIVMKVLSECYYFKKLEEDSPIAFSSLKEKLRYFHPAFHSMTPEGLNSRLTFLNQCVRPGDTIPIKGISDVNDLNARNTTFGPPPICVLRIGDFYHSKVVVRDMNVTYEEGLWDLNPEGIGVQPMIANVTMQVNFIGGHGLEKPVELLQNALTSNFYANTEMYDYRATATEDKTKFTKEFLGDLIKPLQSQLIPQTDTKSSNNIKEGTYIGTLTTEGTSQFLSYDDLIGNVFTTTSNYFNGHKVTMENITNLYGYKIASMFFSPTYREVNVFDVQTGAGVLPLTIMGQYKKNNELFTIANDFAYSMDQKINTTNISILMGLDKDFGDPIIKKSEEFLKPYVKSEIKSILEKIPNNKDIKYVEKVRGEFTNNLDKLNFIIEVGYDGKILPDNVYSGATLSGYTYPDLYDKYKTCISYAQDNFSKLMEGLDTSITFNKNLVITDELLSEFLSILLTSGGILSVYSKDKTIFNESVMKKITKRVNKFVVTTPAISPKIGKYPTPKDNTKKSYLISDNSHVFTDTQKTNLTKIMSSRVDLAVKLNYYKQ